MPRRLRVNLHTMVPKKSGPGRARKSYNEGYLELVVYDRSILAIECDTTMKEIFQVDDSCVSPEEVFRITGVQS